MRATCWVIPKTIWNRFADHPANSRLARPGTGGLDETAALPRVSTGSSIKGETSQGASPSSYQPGRRMSRVHPGSARLDDGAAAISTVDSRGGNRQFGALSNQGPPRPRQAREVQQ